MRGECRKTLRTLQEFLQATLGEAEADRVRLHLSGCDHCSADRDTLRAVLDLNPALTSRIESVLPSFRQQVLKRIEGISQAPAGSTFLYPVWAGRAAVAAAVAVILFLPVLFNVVDFSVQEPEISLVSASTQDFTITFEQERLVITWPENGDHVHRIAKSRSPIDFSHAQIREVQGNRWVDDEPQPVGTVYFYQVD
jgi:hypothetical protein